MTGKGKTIAKQRRRHKQIGPLGALQASGTASSTAFKPARKYETQTVQSTYEPSSAAVPYAQRTMAPEKQSLVRAEVNGHCLFDPYMTASPHPSLLDEFFPENGIENGTSALDDKWSLETGWKGWPDGSLGHVAERDIVRCFVELLNHIIDDLGQRDVRVAIDRQNFPIPTHDGGKLKPDVLLWGRGSPAFPPMKEKPDPITISKKKRGYDECDNDDNAEYQPDTPVPEKPPAVLWPWCVIPIEIKTEKKRGGEGTTDPFVQLGTYAREVLVAQPNRRFVPSLLLTELTVEFIIWDREGVVISERVHYHDPEVSKLFCRMLVSFVTWNDVELGFDPTIFYEEAPQGYSQHIRTSLTGLQSTEKRQQPVQIMKAREEVEYVVEETIFRSYTIRGRGSTCWRAQKVGDDPTRYVILDSWVAGGAAAEREILDTIEHAQLAAGVAHLVHIGDVWFPIDASTGGLYQDTVNGNRVGKRFEVPVDLIHIRTVMQCHGIPTPLGQFTSPRELVGALLDVIRGHEQMYRTGKIVHRDIVPWNILIQRDTDKSMGILIDFSCATSIIKGKVVSRPAQTPSSPYFMCSKALLGEKPADSYLDELESIYWVLCVFMSIRKDEDDPSRLTLSSRLQLILDNPKNSMTADAKENHFYAPFRLEVPPSFGPPIERLARNLHGFFQRRLGNTLLEGQEEQEDIVLRDYTDVVRYFCQAYEALAPPTAPRQMRRYGTTVKTNSSYHRPYHGFTTGEVGESHGAKGYVGQGPGEGEGIIDPSTLEH